MCLEYVSLGSRVRPRIFGSRTVGSVVSCIFSVSVLLYSAGSGVKSVVLVVVYDAFSMSELFMIHVWR